MVLLLLQLLDRPHHIVRIELIAIREVHALIEVERVGETVITHLPAFGKGWDHLVLLVAAHQSFVHVADEHLIE